MCRNAPAERSGHLDYAGNDPRVLRVAYAGFAHSVEAWGDGVLAGGIYGISLGRAFFGESMFTRVTNASKAAFCVLSQRLQVWEFTLIDCQITNPHLQTLGASEISRPEFLERLAHTQQFPDPPREVVEAPRHSPNTSCIE